MRFYIETEFHLDLEAVQFIDGNRILLTGGGVITAFPGVLQRISRAWRSYVEEQSKIKKSASEDARFIEKVKIDLFEQIFQKVDELAKVGSRKFEVPGNLPQSSAELVECISSKDKLLNQNIVMARMLKEDLYFGLNDAVVLDKILRGIREYLSENYGQDDKDITRISKKINDFLLRNNNGLSVDDDRGVRRENEN